MEALRSLGGAEGLCKALRSDALHGIVADSADERAGAFGRNSLPEPKPESFFMLMVRS